MAAKIARTPDKIARTFPAPIGWRMQEDFDNEEQDVIRDAFRYVNTLVPAILFYETVLGSPASLIVDGNRAPLPDEVDRWGTNHVYPAEPGFSPEAWIFLLPQWFRAWRIARRAKQFNLVVHEILHVLGFQHTYNPFSIMCQFWVFVCTNWWWRKGLLRSERAELRRHYV